MKSIALILVVALFAPSHAFWTRCGGINAPTSINSSSCSGTTCTFARGSTIDISVVGTFPRSHASLMTRLTIRGTVIPQAPPYDNACNAISCPTVPNQQVTIAFPIPIRQEATTGTTTARYELLENGVVEMCADISITIT